MAALAYDNQCNYPLMQILMQFNCIKMIFAPASFTIEIYPITHNNRRTEVYLTVMVTFAGIKIVTSTIQYHLCRKQNFFSN